MDTSEGKWQYLQIPWQKLEELYVWAIFNKEWLKAVTDVAADVHAGRAKTPVIAYMSWISLPRRNLVRLARA